MTTQSYIYFVRPIEAQGPIKVGCSNTPRRRLEAIMTWSPILLELIGSVPGTSEDERFFHRCFADLHTHGEWFRAEKRLVDAIDEVIAADTVSVLRGKLKPIRDIRRPGREKRSPEYKRCFSYRMRIFWAERHLQLAVDAWAAPQDIDDIMKAWVSRTRVGGDMRAPTNSEIARLEEYLAAPALHSRVPIWARSAA